MRSVRALPVLAMAVAMTVAACAPSSEDDTSQIFRLAEVGGQPLPVTYPEEDGCEEELLSAVLFLETDGAWKMELRKRELCDGDVAEDEDLEEGTYTLDGSTYRFAGPPAGTSSPGELEIESLTEGTLTEGMLTARLADGTSVTFRPR